MKPILWEKVRRAAVVATVTVSALPAALQAQAPASDCKINDSSPYQVNGAKQYVLQAANSKYPDQVPKLLQNAVRVLTENPEKINNEVGRQYMLLRAYAQWLQKDGAQMVMKRSDLGFTTNPQGTYNLLLGVDSAATAVEKAMPNCKATVSQYRTKFLGEILNKSIAALNADQHDSAAYYAQTSLLVASADPRPWNVLTSVYQKTNKLDSATIAMEKVIELSGTDTLFRKIAQQSRYNLAVLTLQNAEAAQGAARDQQVAKARAMLETYLKVTPGDASAQQALGRALRLSGDTAAVVAIFAEMLKTPEKFTDVQLFEAASNAASSGQDANAVKLFEAGLEKNPYHRVALLNLANVLFGMKDADRMGPVVQRVMTLDPHYDTGWRLMAGYFQLKAQKETDAAKKKAMNDSVLFYLDKQTKTNPRVDVNLAQKNGNAYELQGTVTNESATAGSYTIKFELLDAKGTVVGTKDVAVGPVDAKGNATFSLKMDAPTAVGFRYAPFK
jgi:tetratricopeptide (TPR) repeat protein